MAFAQLLIVILACLCLHSLAQRWGVQPEILIMVVACAVSFIPGIPHPQLSPGIILGLVTPPLLYSAALHFSPYGFVRNLRPILGLGVGLGVAATVGAHQPVENPALALLLSVIVGSFVGLVIGLAAAYLIAEGLESSDVFAVVIAGFTVSTATWLADRRDRPNVLPAVRLQESQLWPVVDVLLESFVFAYIGLQCKTFLLEGSTSQHSRPAIIGIALVLLVVVIVVRILGVFLLYWRVGRRQRVRESHRSAHAAQRPADESANSKDTGASHGWKSALLGSWAGMRGILTLAAAASIPLVTSSGAPFPERDAIQRIAFIVTIGTIIIQGMTMPALARALRFDSSAQLAETEAMLHRTLDLSADAARSTPEETDARHYARQRRSVIDELRARRITDTVASQAIHHIDLQESVVGITSR